MNFTFFAIGLAVLAGCDAITVKPLTESDSGEPSASFSKNVFQADEFVRELWRARLVPAVSASAVELSQAIALQKKGQLYVSVKARGAVLGAGERAGNQGFEIDAEPGDGTADLWVQTGGPEGIDGMAIRDGSGVVGFEQFANQIQFAEVAMALGRHAESKVVAPLLTQVHAGATVNVTGVLASPQAGGALPCLAPVLLTVEANPR